MVEQKGASPPRPHPGHPRASSWAMRRYPGISPSDSLGRKPSPARFRRTQRQSLGQRELYSCPRPPGGVPSGRPRPSSKGGASLAPPHTDPKHSPAGRPHEEPDGRDEERAAASCARVDFDCWAHGSLQKGPPCARASGDLTSGTVSMGGVTFGASVAPVHTASPVATWHAPPPPGAG